MAVKLSTEPIYDVFVSFAWDDLEEAREIVAILEDEGYVVFFAPRDFPNSTPRSLRQRILGRLRGGLRAPLIDDLDDRLRSALSCSRSLLLLWGQGANGSEWCEREVRWFREINPSRVVRAFSLQRFPEKDQLSGIEWIETREDLRQLRSVAFPDQERTPIERSLLRAAWELLARPERWALAARAREANESLLELMMEPGRWTDRDEFRLQKRARLIWYGATLLGVLLFVLLAAGLGLLGQSLLASFRPEYARSIVLVVAIAIAGGTSLAFQHGFGAGLSGTIGAMLIGTLGAIWAAASGETQGGVPGGLAFGGLIGASAGARSILARVDRSVPMRAPRIGGLALASFAIGSGLAYAAIWIGFDFREAVLRSETGSALALRGWSGLSVEKRALFGGLLGMLSGAAGVLGLAQRTGYQVRPRDARMRGLRTAIISMFTFGIAGALLATLPNFSAATPSEATAIGVLAGVVAVSIYVWPSLPAGRKATELTKSIFGLAGTLALLGVSRGFLGQLEGFADQQERAVAAAAIGLIVMLALRLGVRIQPAKDPGMRRAYAVSFALHICLLTLGVCGSFSETPAPQPPPAPGPIWVSLEVSPVRGNGIGRANAPRSKTTAEMSDDELVEHFQSMTPAARYKALKTSPDAHRYHRAFCKKNPEVCEKEKQRKERETRRGARHGFGTANSGAAGTGSGLAFAGGGCLANAVDLSIAIAPGTRTVVRVTQFEAGGDPGLEVRSESGSAVLKKGGPHAFGPFDTGTSPGTLRLIGQGARLCSCNFGPDSISFNFEDAGDGDCNEPRITVDTVDLWTDLADHVDADAKYRAKEEAFLRRTGQLKRSPPNAARQ